MSAGGAVRRRCGSGIDTADWVAVAFNVPVAEFVTPRQLETRDPVAQLGPDLLGVEFDRDEAIRRIVASGRRGRSP